MFFQATSINFKAAVSAFCFLNRRTYYWSIYERLANWTLADVDNAILNGLNPILEFEGSSPSLTIDPFSLSVGSFAVNLIAELSDTEPKLRSSKSTLFRVKASPPVAVINGQGVDHSRFLTDGSVISLNYAQSYPQASDQANPIFTILWSCRPFSASCDEETERRSVVEESCFSETPSEAFSMSVYLQLYLNCHLICCGLITQYLVFS